jgi:hypothetical protein
MNKLFYSLCFIAAALAFSSVAFAQKVEKEGKAWLARNTEAAAINVSGAWQAKEWGRVILAQGQGNAEVTGTGDGWTINGSVSGNKVFLMFSDKRGRINYSAELTQQGTSTLTGGYARGLMEAKTKTKPMTLTK